MKITNSATTALFTVLAFGAVSGFAAPGPSDSGSPAAESPAVPAVPPKGVPPLVGLAKALPKDPDSALEYSWSLEVSAPKVVWEMIVKESPKGPWCEVEADVKMVTLKPEMGYSEKTQLSDLGQNRLVDIQGRRLERDEALKRLAKPTPVLVAPTGEMPDPFYLQCAKPDTLIVIFGLPSPKEFSLLPTAKKAAPKKNAETR